MREVISLNGSYIILPASLSRSAWFPLSFVIKLLLPLEFPGVHFADNLSTVGQAGVQIANSCWEVRYQIFGSTLRLDH